MSVLTSLSGYPEWLPEDRLVEQAFIRTIQERFELFGYTSLETRAVEPLDVILSKGETDKEIYSLRRLQAAADEADTGLGLHFDLTVPFARYIRENRGQLTFPFRRYQIQKAWRGERPGLGRYREFLQADIDLIDSRPLTIQSDIEVIQIIRDILSALPIPAVTLLVNNRKLLDGFYRAMGIEQIAEVLRIVDKLDKIGEEKVRFYLMENLGIPHDTVERCIRLGRIRGNTALEIRKRVEECGLQHPRLQEGLDELCTVLDIFGEQAGCRVTADLSIARGFDYYTGTVCEGKFDQFPRYPTIVAGGRYDHLATDNAAKLPGVGMSLGVTRILGLVLHEGLIRASRKTPVCVMVVLVSEETRPRSLEIAQILRGRGIPCEVYTRPDAYGKQIAYADSKIIPYVWFPSETGPGHGELRDLHKRTQTPADPHQWTPAREDLAVTIQWNDTARQALLINPKYCKK